MNRSAPLDARRPPAPKEGLHVANPRFTKPSAPTPVPGGDAGGVRCAVRRHSHHCGHDRACGRHRRLAYGPAVRRWLHQSREVQPLRRDACAHGHRRGRHPHLFRWRRELANPRPLRLPSRQPRRSHRLASRPGQRRLCPRGRRRGGQWLPPLLVRLRRDLDGCLHDARRRGEQHRAAGCRSACAPPPVDGNPDRRRPGPKPGVRRHVSRRRDAGRSDCRRGGVDPVLHRRLAAGRRPLLLRPLDRSGARGPDQALRRPAHGQPLPRDG